MSLGFGKQSGPATPSGPSEPPNGRPFFGGNFGARPPSPSPPVTPPFFGAAPLRSPSRGLEVLGNPHSPPFGSQSARPAAIPPFQSAGVHRSPNSLPSWDGRQNAFPKNYDTQAHQRPSAVTSFVLSRNSETSVTARVARFPDSKGIRSPPFLSKDESIRNSAQDAPRSQLITPRTESLPLSYADLHPFDGVEGSPNSLPSWDDRQNSLKNYDTQAHQRPSAVTSFVVSRNSGPSVTARVARFQESKGTRSPPFLSKDESIRNSTQGAPRSHLITPRTRSPPLSYADLHPFDGVEGHAVPSSGMDSRPKLLHAHAEPQAQQDPSLVSPFQGSYTSGRHFPLEYDDVQVPKRTRPSVSPAGLNTNSNGSFGTRDSRVQQRSLQSASNAVSKTAASNLTNIPVSKRTRSPPLLPEGQGFEENSYTTQDGTEREMQAKAKRLARFKVELSKSPQNTPNIVEPEVSANRHEQYNIERNKVVAYNSTESAMDGTDGNDLSESEGVESSGIIIGSCPDMCPESERGERERKGDLDQYERLEGDRNQTSMSLAVKKYNRTAERTATLIRPMPILQKTIDYLLNLLNQPYNDRFLSIYNFLWDRMRAIRMDLRMQHIFNQEAITMLEQMIRLHIIAMHELCEYSRGEGFAEGFDAHLNIEQMNKTSVELFQLYDDHRKNGINIPTEKEFRGYYALLKLDKHPGYMVEPAELSLDLAKMTPEIRQTPEVLFARDVARACRTGNFIAFFRLARKASYLQACLMHAHFSKLRTQALASIHAGVQSHQGLPIADISKWLAMEEEEIESLSEYHGFILKSYQEPYIVKEGPFLNGDEDYPTKCSTLVNTKKSGRIVEDVLPSSQVTSLSANATKEIQRTKTKKPEPKILSSYVGNESPALHASAIKVIKSVPDVDHQMLSFESVLSPRDARKVPNFECVSSPKEVRQKQQIIPTPVFSSPQDVKQKQQMIGTPIFGQYSGDAKVTGVPPSPWTNPSFKPQLDKVATMEKPNYDAVSSNPPEQCLHSGMEGMPWQTESRTVLQERFPVGAYSDGFEPPVGQTVVINELEEEETPDLHQEDENNDVLENYQHEEIAKAKFKLILRLWKRRSVKLRALREQRELAATAALNSLSLGPPIQLKTDQPSTSGNFDIDLVLRERYKKHGQSWSRLNVSDVVWDILGRRTPDARCLCWKTVVCSQMNNLEGSEVGQRSHVFGASPWLLSKLIPSANENDDEDLVRSSRGMSIWKKWDRGQSSSGLKCCLSVVKDASFDNLIECVSGASAILFLASESIPWKLQKVQLRNLLLTIPCGSCLPLLILTDLHRNDMADFSSIIVDNLGLHDLDKSRISSFMIVPLIENQEAEQFDGFYSDRRLREGLQWLASESPLQPILHHVTMRELVLTHVNSSLEALDNMKDYEVAPDKCILAFNEALNWSQEAIAAAVRANPSCWPCPEIALLEEFSDEYRVVERHCPNVGWSSMAKFESLKSALRDCRLPPFPEHISWLPGCYEEGKEIENLRDELENGLIGYLTHSSKMMSLALAMTEAHVMLQRSCRLERHDSGWYIVPNWVMIFRRIFNWRLMGLSNGTFSSTYILEGSRLDTNLGNVSRLGFEDILPSPYYLNRPSLDEIIEVSCRPLLPPRGQLMLEGGSTLPDTSINGEMYDNPNTNDLMYDEGSLTDDGQLAIDDVSQANGKLENANREMVVAGEVAKGAEALSMLIEQCNIVQNGVDERLSIYF